MMSRIDLIRQQRIYGNENNKWYNEYYKIYNYFFILGFILYQTPFWNG